MEEVLGCSKCRYSQKGCARCRDPAFRERQLTSAPGRRKLNGPGKSSKRGKKRPAEVSREERDLLERPEGSKRTRFTRKARKPGGHARNTAAGMKQQNVGPQLGRSTHTTVEEPASTVHAENGQATLANSQDPSASQAAPEAPEAAQQSLETSEPQTDSQGTAAKADVEAAGGPAKQVASGLELGLMAGLLPLQQGCEGAEPARTSLEEAALVSKEPDSKSVPGKKSEAASEDKEGKAVQSTSEQSRDVSQTSTGVSSLDTAQRAQRVEDSKERQRQFMEQLQRKVQDNKQQTEASSKPCLAVLLASAARKKTKDQKQKIVGDPRASMWEPPQSPFGLIEEQLFGNPWKLLIACILLNKTNVAQVRKVIWKLFEMMPTPEAGMHADEAAVRELIQPLGLAPKRAPMLIRFCKDYVEKQWVDPKELHGVGQYAADAYNIFCRGDWRSVSPTDKDLLKYHQWLTETNGEGSGLLRETEPQPEPQLSEPVN